jgi:glycosyltransferase 2 family protein
VRQLRRAEPIIGPSPRRALPALQVALILASAVWFARRVDPSLVIDHLRSLPFVSLLIALGWSCVAMYCFTARWRLFLRAWGATPPTTLASLSLVLRSTFWNLLPGGVAGDLARSAAVRHSVGGLGNALAALWFERLGGLAGLFLVALGAHVFSLRASSFVHRAPLLTHRAFVFTPALPAWLIQATFLGFVGSLALLALSLAATRSATLARRFATLPLVGSRLGTLTPPSRPRDLGLGLLLSLLTQSTSVISLAVVVHALSPSADFDSVIALSPAAILLTFVPLTPAGIGQREAVFSMVYAQAGVATEVAVAASVTSFALSLLFPVVGGLLALLQSALPVQRQKP